MGREPPSVSEPLGAFARRVRDLGEQLQTEMLTIRKIAASMDDAWEFAALICFLGGGEVG